MKERKENLNVELRKCLWWTAANLDSEALCCSCCEEIRGQLVGVLTQYGIIDRPEFRELKESTEKHGASTLGQQEANET